jgi:hypothetical protein
MDLARAGQMARFDHERLDVYQVSVRTVALVYARLDRTPRGFADLAAQTKRAAFSVPLNIAEAAGEFSKPESAASSASPAAPRPNAPLRSICFRPSGRSRRRSWRASVSPSTASSPCSPP